MALGTCRKRWGERRSHTVEAVAAKTYGLRWERGKYRSGQGSYVVGWEVKATGSVACPTRKKQALRRITKIHQSGGRRGRGDIGCP